MSPLHFTTQYKLQLITEGWEAKDTETTFRFFLFNFCYTMNMHFRRNHQFLPSFTVHLFAHLCFALKAQLNIQQAFFQNSFHIWRQRALNPFSVFLHSFLFYERPENDGHQTRKIAKTWQADKLLNILYRFLFHAFSFFHRDRCLQHCST